MFLVKACWSTFCSGAGRRNERASFPPPSFPLLRQHNFGDESGMFRSHAAFMLFKELFISHFTEGNGHGGEDRSTSPCAFAIRKFITKTKRNKMEEGERRHLITSLPEPLCQTLGGGELSQEGKERHLNILSLFTFFPQVAPPRQNA